MPAASISASTPTTPAASSLSSGRTSGLVGPLPSWHRTYRATAAATRAIDARKCTDTQTGFSLVSTTIPPSTAWTAIAAG